MKKAMENVVWFGDVNKKDGAMVGGKGANLGEMYGADIPVPNGFIITSSAYFETIQKSGTVDRLRAILFNIDVENPQLLEDKARSCQQEILKLKLDPKLVKDIISHYKKLSGKKNIYVAVRSSATAEDLPGASFAGQQATFLNVLGEQNLIKAVLGAWASLFEARAIFYRVQKNFDHFQVGIAVPVQKMVQSQLSGVMFTIDPITNNKDTVVIEAIYGLGEYIVGGKVTPDHYEVSKSKNKIIQKSIVAQTKQLVRSKEGNKSLAVSKPYQKLQKLDDENILKLAKIGEKIEKHYYFPQDIEWAAEDDKLYIVQTRPVTTIKSGKIDKNKTAVTNILDKSLDVLARGAPASPAISSGRVVVIHSPKELFKIKKGDVLVTEMTNPDYVPAMKRAVGVVTDRGGRTSHAAIVSRELGIACVVGTGKATSVLKDGMIVTIDGARGIIYRGEMAVNKKDLRLKREAGKSESSRKTATKLYVNLAEPSLAPKIAGLNVDGVGLLRAEFMLAQIGVHPKQFILERKQDKFVDRLSSDLNIFGRSFGRRNVIYRASDFKSNEYRNLRGGDKFEPKESNPMLGYRGAFRYIKDPDVFKLELEAIIRTRKKHKNIHLMIPFVRSVEELKAVRKMVEAVGLFKDASFKFWMMVEIPVNVVMLEDFIQVGIDGVSIGSNDLTMLILGTDRDNEEVASEFNELNPAVLWAFERIIKTANRLGVTSSICGQAPSVYPQLTDLLIKWGVTSISVNPDVIQSTREIIYQAEEKLLKK